MVTPCNTCRSVITTQVNGTRCTESKEALGYATWKAFATMTRRDNGLHGLCITLMPMIRSVKFLMHQVI